MNATLARRLIKQAQSDESYEGPVPDSDEEAISEANRIVEMAQEAWDATVRGPEVEAILRMAAGDGDNGSQEPAEDQKKDAPPPPPTGEVSDPEPGELDPEQLTEEEPWDGYKGEKVGDIIEAIGIAMDDENEADQEKDDLLAHVWAYESAHKNRARILTALTEIGEQRGKEEESPPEEEGAGAAEDATPPEDDAGGTEGTEGGEGDSQEDGDGDDSESGAPKEPESEAAGEGDQDRPGEHEGEEAGEDQSAYRELIAEAERQVNEQRIHVPEKPDEKIEDLPFNLTELDNKQLQRHHGAYTALAYYTAHLLMLEEAKERLCRQAMTELSNGLLVAAEKYDGHDKAKTITILESEINEDPEVKKWKRRVNKHAAFATVHRQERDSYNKLVESLSRHETMRHNEWERSGGSRKR